MFTSEHTLTDKKRSATSQKIAKGIFLGHHVIGDLDSDKSPTSGRFLGKCSFFG